MLRVFIEAVRKGVEEAYDHVRRHLKFEREYEQWEKLSRLEVWQEWRNKGIEKRYPIEEWPDFGDITHGPLAEMNDERIVCSLYSDGALHVEECGLRRVWIVRPDGSYHILRELLRDSDAANYVEQYNAVNPDEPAESVDYKEAYERALALELSEGRRDRNWAMEDAKDAEESAAIAADSVEERELVLVA